MLLLVGLLLLGATAAFTGLLISENLSGGPDYMVTMFGNGLGTVNTMGAFLSGIALALVFCLALAIMSAGAARQHRHRAYSRAGRRDGARPEARGRGTEPTDAPAPAGRRRRHLFGH
jgi:hypothetical protein